MESVSRERMKRSRPGPQIIVNARRHRTHRSVPDRVAPLITQAPGHVNIAQKAGLHLLHGLPDRRTRAALASMLANHLVLVYGLYQLPAFPQIMRARFLDIYIFLPACAAHIPASECQWFGVAMETASRSLSSSSLRISISVFGLGRPICSASARRLFKTFSSTSQKYAISTPGMSL